MAKCVFKLNIWPLINQAMPAKSAFFRFSVMPWNELFALPIFYYFMWEDSGLINFFSKLFCQLMQNLFLNEHQASRGIRRCKGLWKRPVEFGPTPMTQIYQITWFVHKRHLLIDVPIPLLKAFLWCHEANKISFLPVILFYWEYEDEPAIVFVSILLSQTDLVLNISRIVTTMLPQLNYCWQQLLLMDLVLLTEIGDLNRGGYTVSYEQVLANADGIKPSSTNGFIPILPRKSNKASMYM